MCDISELSSKLVTPSQKSFACTALSAYIKKVKKIFTFAVDHQGHLLFQIAYNVTEQATWFMGMVFFQIMTF